MSKYIIECSVVPICTSCGGELHASGTEAKLAEVVFDRDNPLERVDRRIYVRACENCFVFKGDLPADPAPRSETE